MSRRTFGATWWGRAWVEALEGRAQLDPNRLPRGRTYARKGMVILLEVAPGEIRAKVRGSLPTPYRVTIRTHRFTSAQWDTLLGTVASRAGHAAALLDGELPPELAEDARASGADLLPGPGDLLPRCSCPDRADPCKHSAAVCYLVADEVDADPFVLFLLRGRGRDEVLEELRARRRDTAAPVPRVDQGLTPRAAFARRPAPVPALPPPPRRPVRPAVPAGEPPPGSALRSDVLGDLAADAAVRAWELLRGTFDEAPLSMEEDLARRAAHGDVARLAAAAGVPPKELARWAVAWREAGRGGLAALRESWQPPTGALAEARAELDEAELPGETKVWRNRLTRGDVQLRLGRDHRWYLFRPGPDGWLPAAPGTLNPLDALS
ncbi:SWIM zinc finger family protein [Amycolatopsis cynarae]|uniref:SWIM zinc finger family protein n=1 Tax=Amycolatopsis cynarae TaxID=2995223 RepID=A0ABY7B5E9_9PSEU|nr:SWIM zinc finger family protein [Amycolatopsis sp. HUAS 11-8]WAL67556.1 SWIM zinc finger family protein [Amycolatopsis sp. HUAS 11-8]